MSCAEQERRAFRRAFRLFILCPNVYTCFALGSDSAGDGNVWCSGLVED